MLFLSNAASNNDDDKNFNKNNKNDEEESAKRYMAWEWQAAIQKVNRMIICSANLFNFARGQFVLAIEMKTN